MKNFAIKTFREKLNEYDIFVDFGNSDIFYLKDFVLDEENKKITFKGCQGQMRWIRIDEKYPVKVSK